MKKIMLVLLCLALACPAFGAAAEAPAASPFRTLADALNSGPYEYFSAGYYFVLTKVNDIWWRVEAQLDDRYRELQDALNNAGDTQAAYQEFRDHVRELPVAFAEELPEQPLNPSDLDGYDGKTVRDLLADGFGIDRIDAFTRDESQAAGVPKPLTLTDHSGAVYRVPVYLQYDRYANRLYFMLTRGIYTYQFLCDGTEESLWEAAEKGTWEDLTLREGLFGGFTRDVVEDYLSAAPAQLDVMTDEQAAAVQTVGDLGQFYYIISDESSELIRRYLINGENCFWIGEAVPDEQYRELARAVESAPADQQHKASYELHLHEQTLPVTLKKIDMEHPPRIEDLTVYIGKPFRDLLAEGFEPTCFYASTSSEEKEAFGAVLSLKNSEGREYGSVTGNILFTEYEEFILLNVKQGLYEYMFSLSGNAETLARAAEDGSLQDLEITDASFGGLSADVFSMLDL